MKRPKIRDMNPDQLVRFRLMQARRSARRALLIFNCVQPEELTAEQQKNLEANKRSCQSVIAVTKPSWVQKAPLSDAIRTLEYIVGEPLGVN